jgi:phosphatidylserine/phosphatidylglycerophosphate/cardiolipin synthase-like enzyme
MDGSDHHSLNTAVKQRASSPRKLQPVTHAMSQASDDLVANLEDVGRRGEAAADFPSYNFNTKSDRDKLATTSNVASFRLGSGASIFSQALIPALLSARLDVILVTCFWAPSETLTALSEALTILAARRCAAVERHRQSGQALGGIPDVLRIRIGLSSRSLLQNLLHPQSQQGYVYPPSTWPSQLGLPDEAVLRAGRVDLSVKSLFFLPFSVVHPKLLIVDRERAWLPSCNVSWESWLEGCIEVSGEAVGGLLDFYERVWQSDSPPPSVDGHGPSHDASLRLPQAEVDRSMRQIHSTADALLRFSDKEKTPTLILPSSHHQDPRFWPMSSSFPPAPATPLNTALLHLFRIASRDIYLQTPDLTSPPVLAALLDAVERGVHVKIATCDNIKLWEQILTAGTTTRRCVGKLVADFESRQRRQDLSDDLEAQIGAAQGHLLITYFRTSGTARALGRLDDTPGPEQLVQSHLKLTIVDGRYTVLGSGNMDRASWYTSQELGILFEDRDLAAQVRGMVEQVMQGRSEIIFDSGE